MSRTSSFSIQNPDWTILAWLGLANLPAFVFSLLLVYYPLFQVRIGFGNAMPIVVGLAALGTGIHYLSKKRKAGFKWFSLGCFFLLFGGGTYWVDVKLKRDLASLATSPICGFKCLSQDHCELSGVTLSLEGAQKEGFESLEDYLRAEQIAFFVLQGVTSEADFYDSAPGKGVYLKDSAWQPLVSVSDIQTYGQ